MSKLNYNNIENNKDLYSAGSSGSADAAPRMTKNTQCAAQRMTECGRSSPICHCEKPKAQEVGGVFDFFKTHPTFPYALWEGQTGRSMVEMLGVLAVMGILSVAGIAVYNNAMNKYRANELLNEASKRATVVAAQAMMGRTGTISLGEFGNNSVSGATFGTEAKIENNQIKLTLSGVADPVCAQMKTALGENSIMAVDDKCTILAFNADMSKGVTPISAYDENAGAKACTANADCDAGCQQCSGGKCISKCDVGQYCAKGTSDSDYACTSVTPTTCTSDTNCPSEAPCCANGSCTLPTCPSGTFWIDYGADTWGCVDDSNWLSFQSSGTCSNEIKWCTSNADCDTPDEYCEIRSSTYSCSAADVGRCTSVGTPNTVAKAEGASGSAYNGYVYSSRPMTWWAADNWCKAQGMRLVSLSDLGCTSSGCSDWNTLKDAFGSSSFWTVDSYNSCYVFGVPTYDSSLSSASRNSNGYSALCK